MCSCSHNISISLTTTSMIVLFCFSWDMVLPHYQNLCFVCQIFILYSLPSRERESTKDLILIFTSTRQIVLKHLENKLKTCEKGFDQNIKTFHQEPSLTRKVPRSSHSHGNGSVLYTVNWWTMKYTHTYIHIIYIHIYVATLDHQEWEHIYVGKTFTSTLCCRH
jgi:hypothetical protein